MKNTKQTAVAASKLKQVYQREVSRLATRVKDLAKEARTAKRDIEETERQLKLGREEVADAKQLLARARTRYMKATIRECVNDSQDELWGYREDLRDDTAHLADVMKELKKAAAELERLTK